MKGSDRYLIDGVQCLYDGAPCPVANLSVGGFFVVCDRPPMRGQVLELDVQLGGRKAFRIVGTVSWINTPPDSRAPELPRGFGVKITRIDMRDKIALIDMLRRASEGAQARPVRS